MRAGPAASSWQVQAEGRQAWEKLLRKPLPRSQPHRFAAHWSLAFQCWHCTSDPARICFSFKQNTPLYQLSPPLPPLAFGYVLGSRHLAAELLLPPSPSPLQRIFCTSASLTGPGERVAGTAGGDREQGSLPTSASC